MITFNKPYFTGKETEYIKQAVDSMKISGDGSFTKKCHNYFEDKYGFKKCLLTTSCTDALEMAAILLDIKEGDEVIMPSYTFVSTSNAFVLRGAKIVFVDSLSNHPNMDTSKIEELITSKTKVIVPVHYAGVGCNMDEIMQLATRYNLFVVEDAAQAVDSFYNGKPLGGIGHLGAFSFHETKNIISGEGGMLIVNDERFFERAEVIREKGTNRSKFFRGEVDKYGWVDVGSSFLPSDIIAAFLFAQLENLDDIQSRRKHIWNRYFQKLKGLLEKELISIPEHQAQTTNNAHMFCLLTKSETQRDDLIKFLKEHKIHSVFHYLSLHKSDYYKAKHDGRELVNCDYFANNLLRLPFYYELTDENIDFITDKIMEFYAE